MLTQPTTEDILANKRKKKKQNIKTTEKAKKPFPTRKALTLLAITAAVFILYQVMIKLEKIWIMHVYWIGAGLIAMAYIAVNRGVFRIPKRPELSDELTEDEKDELIYVITKRHKQTTWLLYLFIAILLTLVYDTAYIFLTVNMGVKI